MSRFARGKRALGICDKTGFEYLLDDLVYEYQDGKRTGFRVGKDVYDPDHPQNWIGRVSTDDPQSLLDPRPDRRQDIGLFGFDPVWNDAQFMRTSVGRVTIPMEQVQYEIYEVEIGISHEPYETTDTGFYDVIKE